MPASAPAGAGRRFLLLLRRDSFVFFFFFLPSFPVVFDIKSSSSLAFSTVSNRVYGDLERDLNE